MTGFTDGGRLLVMPDTSSLIMLDNRPELIAALVDAQERVDLIVTHVQHDECKRSGIRALDALQVRTIDTMGFVVSGDPDDGPERETTFSRPDMGRLGTDQSNEVLDALRTGSDGRRRVRDTRDALIITTAWWEGAVLLHEEADRPRKIPGRIRHAEAALGYSLGLIQWRCDDLDRFLRRGA